ncbi:TIGR03862 family flavoprotein [Telmatospirillum siberiense]|uniref:Aminoacetone oxidase family FAD-binding enzyme n=1 Tax=Telmatospirillum siberiense TaxID=382514 RepID=A0A2N3PWV5_9PROT|nr:TIGR03862 family flavoprotein [Telmatospirillum siberiense]PKU24868.1 aminoacetone oxidase family FAD-binding enzyme [Telmatospirillum siberiense]
MTGDGVICVIGGGPAGLMAAETAAAGGADVVVCDAMPSVGRKFLLAGRGGLNLTHSEPGPAFVSRYGAEAGLFGGFLAEFGPDDLRAWARDLGIETFVGSSGRVFPAEFKAAPLLRAWVRRLRDQGITFRPRHRWAGFADDGALVFRSPRGEWHLSPGATVLALGGGSWPHLGSDGGWISPLQSIGCRIRPLRPSNCGFLVAWSSHMAPHFGQPLKAVALSFGGRRLRGEAMLTEYGIEGGAVYALSAALRDAIDRDGSAVLTVDLKPDFSEETLSERLARPRGRLSLSNWLRRTANLPPAAVALLRETAPAEALARPASLARAIKTAPVPLHGARPLAEAISSAGGLCFEELDDDLMVRRRPGLFAAGEMLDWEAPTGGYLLTGCFATGRRAGRGALRWLETAGKR